MIIAFIAFLAAIISFIIKRAKGDSNGLEQAKNMLWWSVIAMFVMVAVWGIVFFLGSNLGIGIGGCAPRPSSIPGVSVDNKDCTNGSNQSGSQTSSGPCTLSSGRPSGCSCNAAAQCKTNVCANSICAYSAPITTVSPVANTKDSSVQCVTNSDCGEFGITCVNGKCQSGTDNVKSACSSNSGRTAANGDLLYCNQGKAGEPCQSGTCSAGHSCNITTYDTYGTCVSIYPNKSNNTAQSEVDTSNYSNEGNNYKQPQESAPLSSYLDDLW